MFSTEKDLRKAVPKRNIKIPHNNKILLSQNKDIQNHQSLVEKNTVSYDKNDTSINITDIAKQERENRAILREKIIHIQRIQCWWRGRYKAWKYIDSVLMDTKKKINDIEKLFTIIQTKNNTIFVSPIDIINQLLIQILFVLNHSKINHIDILMKFCQFVLNPSLNELDASKNVIAYQHVKENKFHLFTSLYYIILQYIPNLTTTNTTTNQSNVIDNNNNNNESYKYIAECLSLMIGTHPPYKMKFSLELNNAFQTFRNTLITNDQIFITIRSILMNKCCHLLTITTEESFQSNKNISTYHSYLVCDTLFKITLFLSTEVEISNKNNTNNSALQTITKDNFSYYIFSIPMLTLFLSTETIKEFCNKLFINRFLHKITNPSVIALPCKDASSNSILAEGNICLQSIFSGQWLLGNLISLIKYLNISHESSDNTTTITTVNISENKLITESCDNQSIISNDALILYINTCISWLRAYMVPGIFQGRSGIIWQKQGASLMAIAVPYGLEKQILSLYQDKVVMTLYDRILSTTIDSPITTTIQSALDYNNNNNTSNNSISSNSSSKNLTTNSDWYINKSDIDDIQHSLTSSSYQITSVCLKEQQEETTMFTSKWAKKLASNLFSTNIFFNSKSKANNNSSSNGMKLINKDVKTNLTQSESYLIKSLCNLWSIMLSSAANSSIKSIPWKTISYIAFANKGDVLIKLWCYLLNQLKNKDIISLSSIYLSSINNNVISSIDQDHLNVLYAFISILKVSLIALDDSEFYELGRPLPLHQILPLIRCLKNILYGIISKDPSILQETTPLSTSNNNTTDKDLNLSTKNINYANNNTNNNTARSSSASSLYKDSIPIDAMNASQNLLETSMKHAIAKIITNILADFYTKWARRSYSSAKLWVIEETSSSIILKQIYERNILGLCIIKVMPWAIDFHERMKIFRKILDEEKLQIQGSNDLLSGGPLRSKGIIIRIRKSRILEDGMNAISKVVGIHIKDRIVVRYVNDFNEEEVGIDAGGLFKDFVTDLSTRIFDPSYGLFCITNDVTNLLYPNPSSIVLYDKYEMEQMFIFLGKVLGKALFENITLQPKFAHFFLAFMNQKYNYMNLLNDLSTLDAELHKNLMFLKTYEGDISELGLTFAITDNSMGIQKEVELIPGGSNIDVTAQNRHRYVNLAAKYYLHDRIKVQATAFFSGLYQVITPEYLGLFCSPELQILISGSESGLDIQDLKRYTNYTGGYLSMDRYIIRFWTIFDELSQEDQSLLLKFVTSCERSPSLGFAFLQPPFTIQKVDCNDDQRLPTASTCFNILKLPTYSNIKIMKEKILQSIRAQAGFDLS